MILHIGAFLLQVKDTVAFDLAWIKEFSLEQSKTSAKFAGTIRSQKVQCGNTIRTDSKKPRVEDPCTIGRAGMKSILTSFAMPHPKLLSFRLRRRKGPDTISIFWRLGLPTLCPVLISLGGYKLETQGRFDFPRHYSTHQYWPETHYSPKLRP